MKKSLGIIGGMGPLATIDLMHKIVALSDVKTDQEHIHIYVDSNPNIADRSKAIAGLGPSPLPELILSGKKLQTMGADALLMPCNTAHYYYDTICDALKIPLIHMPRVTVQALDDKGIRRAGLLATDGTLTSRVYHQELEAQGVEILLPTAEGQRAVMSLIYDCVKANDKNYDITDFLSVIDGMMEQGAEILILGCTELPIAFEQYGLDYPVVNATEELAKAGIRFALQ